MNTPYKTVHKQAKVNFKRETQKRLKMVPYLTHYVSNTT